MPRPLRSTFPYGYWHLTSRGVDGRMIFLDTADRLVFLLLVDRVIRDVGWRCHAYCLMGNHYHLVIECGQPELSKGMQLLNGLYAAYFNHRHGRVGHLFQRRFESRAIESEGRPRPHVSVRARQPRPGGTGPTAPRTGRGAASAGRSSRLREPLHRGEQLVRLLLGGGRVAQTPVPPRRSARHDRRAPSVPHSRAPSSPPRSGSGCRCSSGPPRPSARSRAPGPRCAAAAARPPPCRSRDGHARTLRNRRSRSEFETTKRLEAAIAPAATIGFR